MTVGLRKHFPPPAPGPHGSGLAGADAAFDSVVVTDSAIALTGWLLSRDYPIDHARLQVDGIAVGETAVALREDVGRHFPDVAHAARSGVEITGPLPPGVPPGQPLRIELIGQAGGRDVIAHEHYRHPGHDIARAAPAAHLIARIAGSPDPDLFRDYGLTIAAQLLAAIRRHLAPGRQPRLLDWGCGPGRATQYLAELWPGIVVTGCDIDAEAIAWARAHVPGVTFEVTPPYPPLPFANDSFDAVIASSVMTHLTAKLQLQWLREIRRVLAPGGIFAPSVHGPFAAARTHHVSLPELRQAGIVDRLLDGALDGIAPDQYYRGTLQTVEYTYDAWGREMPILAYREAGLVNHQDLVVLRKDAPAQSWVRRLLKPPKPAAG